jgi:hypothetical protein
MKKSRYTTSTIDGGSVGEFVHAVNDHLNPIITSPTLSPTRTYSSPLMGTSARAAKRRMDGDSGPIRIEGTDIYNQQLQHHYQNVRQVLQEQQPNNNNNNNQIHESRPPIQSQRDIFEQKFRSPSFTYDLPPHEHRPAQKIITTITTTTTKSPTMRHQSNTSLNEQSSPVDRLLEHAAELQKLSNPNSPNRNESFVFERKEQCQVFVDPVNNEIRSTTTLPITKFGHATDLDEAQSQVDRFVDDHQAIQNLTRALQEHNTTTTITDYKRLPTQASPILINTTTTTTATIPSNIILPDQPIKSEFTVIDALLDNPLGTNNNKQNTRLHTRFNNILSNLRNSEYVNMLKQSTAKVTKKKKAKKPARGSSKTALVDKETQITEAMIDPTLVDTDQSPILTAKEKKRRKKNKPKNIDYQVLDAVLGSPISLRLPESYVKKYKLRPAISLTRSLQGRDHYNPIFQPLNTKARTTTDYDLVNVVNELSLHHTDAPNSSFPSTGNDLQQSIRSGNRNRIQPRRSTSNQTQQTSDPVRPRVLYRYMDEHGQVLKISSTAPKELRDVPSPESPLANSRPLFVDDERHRILSEQRPIWQQESILPTSVTRKDFELRDKRVPKITEQHRSTSRTIPISIERKHSESTPSQSQTRSPQRPNQEDIQRSRLPLSYQLDQQYASRNNRTGYDSDSSTSEPSSSYPARNYKSTANNHSRHNHRPLFQTVHQSNPSPTRLPSGNRRISPDYSAKGLPRNYIEVFRDGEIKPSEVYSLPFNESSSPNHHHSRYEQYHESETQSKHQDASPTSKYAKIIPSLSNHESYFPHTQHHDQTYFDSYLRPSKSFDYRPLRTKLQREYKITPSLLVDEWDHPQTPTSNNYSKQAGASSTDDVFITNYRINKA